MDNYTNLGIANVNSYLNVRKEPKKNGEIIGKMIRFSGCEILEDAGDWYKIKSGPVIGYVSKEYILTGEDAELIAVQEARLRAIVTTESNLNVRKEPSADSKKITKITTDERYDVLNQVNGWIEISLEGNDDGKDMSSGFISADYAEVKYALIEAYEFSPVTSSSSLRNSVVNYALQFLGNRYVWGGTSPVSYTHLDVYKRQDEEYAGYEEYETYEEYPEGETEYSDEDEYDEEGYDEQDENGADRDEETEE